MASLNYSGLDDVYREIAKMGDSAEAAITAMLKAGAREVAEAWRLAIDKFDLKDSGEMRKAVAPTRNIKGDVGSRFIEIFPQGRDSKGKRNVEKAFLNHYGVRDGSPATGFVDIAEEYAESMAVPVMREAWEKYK